MNRRRTRSSRGFSLIEVMVSMGILAFGILGVAQMQVIASTQNGIARRTSRASAIARDFAETGLRWEWNDPRLAVGTGGLPADEAALGTGPVPLVQMDYTASPSTLAAPRNPSNEGVSTGALSLGGSAYDGLARVGTSGGLLGDPQTDGYQLMWSVRVDATNYPNMRKVYVVVRYPIGNGLTYRNVLTTFIKFNNNVVGPIREVF